MATVIEPSTDFYDAEAYHQKWLLQRKADYFKTLQLADSKELLDSHAASRLNGYVGGHIRYTNP